MAKKTKKKSKKLSVAEVLQEMHKKLSREAHRIDPARKSYLSQIQKRYVENPVDGDFVSYVENLILETLSWYDEYVYQNNFIWSFEDLAKFVFVKLEKYLPDYDIDEDWVLDTVENVLYKGGYTDVRSN